MIRVPWDAIVRVVGLRPEPAMWPAVERFLAWRGLCLQHSGRRFVARGTFGDGSPMFLNRRQFAALTCPAFGLRS